MTGTRHRGYVIVGAVLLALASGVMAVAGDGLSPAARGDRGPWAAVRPAGVVQAGSASLG